ncbi:MAG: hydantoinase/oxoprolinase family protein [Deinococcota bacterium]
MSYRFGFDIGGTFTDFVLIDNVTGAMSSYKTLTTPDNPARAVIEGWTHLLEDANINPDQVDNAIHGTTLITNALIERKGAPTLLLVTKGFRDVLDTQKEMRYDIYDLHAEPVTHLVPRPLRFDVDERRDAFGDVITPLNIDSLEAMKAVLEQAGVTQDIESVAVCLLHAFTNSEHEQQVANWLEQNLPHLTVSLSSQVAPQVREYERMSTTVCNAYVQPLTSRYLQQLADELKTHGFQQDLYVMLSSGGICTLDTACTFPVRLVESGPAAGALAAMFYGKLTGHENLMSFDMGGTTAKMCLIDGGQPAMSDSFEIARVHRFKRGSGLPIRVPTIELIEIGAGGGSIARVDELGLLKVGPESAGASPGPACYGLGGDKPTVTDADLLLGYLNPDFFLGGRMSLDVDAATRAITKHLAKPLEIEVSDAAYGVYRVVNEAMISATRVHIAERGADPRRLQLIAFGGAGPMHAHAIASALNMKGYILPASAGVASALGFLTAPIAFEFVRTFISELTPATLPELDDIYSALETEGRKTLAEAGVAEADMTFTRQADLRHVGQGYDVTVSLPYSKLAEVSLETDLKPRFYSHYESIYGHAHKHLNVAISNCRLTASGPKPEVTLQVTAELEGSHVQTALKGHRPVYFAEAGGFTETPRYDRNKFASGMAFTGPAIIEEIDSTAVIGPNTQVRVDDINNLIVTFTDADVAPTKEG